jgi:hypothetical protein
MKLGNHKSIELFTQYFEAQEKAVN